MRILHIVGTISPAAGGPTEVVRMLVRYAPPGYTSELVTLDDPAAPFLTDLPFPVHALGSSTKSWYSPRLIPWLHANRHRFDGIIVHGLWEFTGLAVSLAHGHTPYVVFPHGMLDPYFKRRYPRKHIKKWLYWLPAEYWVLRRATRVLFTTETERTLASQSFWLHRWKPLVVALGTEPPPADTVRLLAAFHERVPSLKDKRFLLFLGRIDPKKGPDLLLEAFTTAESVHKSALNGTDFSPYVESAQKQGAGSPGLQPWVSPEGTNSSIAASTPDLHLVMAGPATGTCAEELRSRTETSDRIHWPGMLLGDAKWGALAACDAFVLPSHQENFGIAVVEALACGKPVLLSDQVNIAPEIAADGCGFVAPDTLDGTMKLLQNWLNTTEQERSAMSEQARKTFATRYDMRHNTKTILQVFEQQAKP